MANIYRRILGMGLGIPRRFRNATGISVVRDSLLGWWKSWNFTQTNNIPDQMSQNDGVLQSGVVLSFDGINDKATFKNELVFTGAFSINAVLAPSIADIYLDNSGNNKWIIWFNGANISFQNRTGGGNEQYFDVAQFSDYANLYTGKYYNFTWTKDSNDDLRLYINGEPIPAKNGFPLKTGEYTVQGDGNYQYTGIGQYSSSTFWFGGKTSRLEFFDNYTLSEEEAVWLTQNPEKYLWERTESRTSVNYSAGFWWFTEHQGLIVHSLKRSYEYVLDVDGNITTDVDNNILYATPDDEQNPMIIVGATWLNGIARPVPQLAVMDGLSRYIDHRTSAGNYAIGSVNPEGTALTLVARFIPYIVGNHWVVDIPTSDVAQEMGFFINSTTILWVVIGSGVGTAYTFESGVEYEVVLTYDGARKKAYVNGVLIADAAQVGTPAFTANEYAMGVASSGTTTNSFAGIILHTGLIGKALSADEIFELWDGGIKDLRNTDYARVLQKYFIGSKLAVNDAPIDLLQGQAVTRVSAAQYEGLVFPSQPDENGNLVDIFGNKLTWERANNEFISGGVLGSATTSKAGIGQVASAASLDVTGDFSMEVELSSLQTDGYFQFIFMRGSSIADRFGLEISSGAIRLDRANTGLMTVDIDESTHYLVTLTWDTANYKIYINGFLVATLASALGFTANGTNIGFGWCAYTYNNDFRGTLTDFKMYDKALSQLEITQNYLAHVGTYNINVGGTPRAGVVAMFRGENKREAYTNYRLPSLAESYRTATTKGVCALFDGINGYGQTASNFAFNSKRSGWVVVKTIGQEAFGAVIGRNYTSSLGKGDDWNLWVAGNKIALGMGLTGETQAERILTHILKNDRFYVIGWTIDYDNEIMKLYVDGVKVAEASFVNYSFGAYVARPLVFNAIATSATFPSNNEMSRCQIFKNELLTDDDHAWIAENVESNVWDREGTLIESTDLDGEWRFIEGNILRAWDYSGNDNDVTLVASTWGNRAGVACNQFMDSLPVGYFAGTGFTQLITSNNLDAIADFSGGVVYFKANVVALTSSLPHIIRFAGGRIRWDSATVGTVQFSTSGNFATANILDNSNHIVEFELHTNGDWEMWFDGVSAGSGNVTGVNFANVIEFGQYTGGFGWDGLIESFQVHNSTRDLADASNLQIELLAKNNYENTGLGTVTWGTRILKNRVLVGGKGTTDAIFGSDFGLTRPNGDEILNIGGEVSSVTQIGQVNVIEIMMKIDTNNQTLFTSTTPVMSIDIDSSNDINYTGTPTPTYYINGVAGQAFPLGEWALVTIELDDVEDYQNWTFTGDAEIGSVAFYLRGANDTLSLQRYNRIKGDYA